MIQVVRVARGKNNPNTKKITNKASQRTQAHFSIILVVCSERLSSDSLGNATGEACFDWDQNNEQSHFVVPKHCFSIPQGFMEVEPLPREFLRREFSSLSSEVPLLRWHLIAWEIGSSFLFVGHLWFQTMIRIHVYMGHDFISKGLGGCNQPVSSGQPLVGQATGGEGRRREERSGKEEEWKGRRRLWQRAGRQAKWCLVGEPKRFTLGMRTQVQTQVRTSGDDNGGWFSNRRTRMSPEDCQKAIPADAAHRQRAVRLLGTRIGQVQWHGPFRGPRIHEAEAARKRQQRRGAVNPGIAAGAHRLSHCANGCWHGSGGREWIRRHECRLPQWLRLFATAACGPPFAGGGGGLWCQRQGLLRGRGQRGRPQVVDAAVLRIPGAPADGLELGIAAALPAGFGGGR